MERAAFGDDPVRRWYENELGWPTVPASAPESPVRLRLGLRFDVLDVPAEAGRVALRHLAEASPVALWGDRMLLLVAAGSAEELPGLLDWLEWGTLALDLRMVGTGGEMQAPCPPEPGVGRLTELSSGRSGSPVSGEDPSRVLPSLPEPGGLMPRPSRKELEAAKEPQETSRAGGSRRPLVLGRPGALQGAAVWVRPPEPGCEVEASLPTVSALRGGGGAPDLVRVVNTVATQCHRLRLRCARP
ncbi:proline-rich protein [Streptomyces sviceus ATCC 29083]|uniref:Proline-rich protein n=1 Tax=Streptomyces sviceus (strain ATCC 29083 / DSM 924 / JCM 4929 / NBRC 13980 / NCIMB 11184 / NRRL 5439 / UC 5370) TaxID=463191 RepID=B5HYG5_STRX2|nr:proline-rich protein [Streptomyces sviceus ATCC 29083]